MSWGALGGLGQGLQAVGREWGERQKQALAEKLASEREVAREERAEARERRKVAKENMIERGGKWYNQRINSYGDVISEEAATPDQVRARARDEQLADLTLESKGLEAALRGKQVNTFDEDRQWKREDQLFDREQEERRTRASETSARASLERALSSGRGNDRNSDKPPVEKSQVARQLVTDYEDLIGSYIESGELSMQDVHAVAQSVVREATARGKDYGDSFQRALRAMAEKKKGSTR